MRPWTALKPCEPPRKYAGLLLEQPMPDSFDDLLRIDAHLVERVDDALGDRVVAAAGAQRRLAALVDLRFEPDSVHFEWCPAIVYSPPCHARADDRRCGRFLRHFEPFLRQHVVGDAAGVDRQAVVVQHAAQLRLPLRRQLELHQLQQLRVAVLLDDVDALVRVDERAQLVVERIARAAGSTTS